MERKRLSIRVVGLSALPAPCRRPALFARAVGAAFARERPRAAGEVNVVVLPRGKMRAMNREFLGHDFDTDVVAFAHESPPGLPARERPLGDIYISSWMTVRQAKELGHSPLREALTLAVHGSLHLLGHDDRTPRSKARMFRRQDEILAGIAP